MPKALFKKNAFHDCICLKVVNSEENQSLNEKFIRYPISAIQGVNS